jgi:riboflavin synthase
MFTGLIEGMGRVIAVEPRRGSSGYAIEPDRPMEGLAEGESIAVDGVCLTVAGLRGNGFLMDAIAETLSRTTLGELTPGSRVNLERALRLGDRLGGHLVQGHVDGTAAVTEIRRDGDDHRVRIDLPAELERFVAFKGSIALAGVSLTVSELGPSWFEVALIPVTLAVTTLGALRVGTRLNVEVDLLARYLERLAGQDRDGD